MFRSFTEDFIVILSNLLIFLIIARVILSWFRMPLRGRLFHFLYDVTEPILVFFRRLVPPLGGVVDISPILAYFAIEIVSSLLLRAL